MGDGRFSHETLALGRRTGARGKGTGTLYEPGMTALRATFISLERLTFPPQKGDDVPKIDPNTAGMTKVERGQRLSRHKAEAADEPDD